MQLGILPMKVNLIGRFIGLDPFYPRCGTKVEIMVHVLRECEWVQEV